jgi:hypothetical protein
MDLNSFLQRAKSALDMPTFYWLYDEGGPSAQPDAEQPGTPFDIESALVIKLRVNEAAYNRYLAFERRSGIARSTLPHVATDCSGFVCWALGVKRNGWPGPNAWLNTDSMMADVDEKKYDWVVPLDMHQAVPGALMVYRSRRPKNGVAGQKPEPGHVAIVTQVDDQGNATEILHCNAHNYLIAPSDGRLRNAIALTDTSPFEGETWKYLMWKGLA